MVLFRLLHISDLHIAESGPKRYRQSKCELPLLKEIARYAYKYRDNIDCILISGDLADIGGYDGDTRAALSFVSSPSTHNDVPWLIHKQGAPTLATNDLPVRLLPGNHDRYKSSKRFPGSKLFDKHFGKYWNDTNGISYNQETIKKGGESIIVLCADFSLRSEWDGGSPIGFFGKGRVYNDQLETLKETVNNIKKDAPSSAILLGVHFAPESDKVLSGINQRNLKLINDSGLLTATVQHGINFLFCGHTHKSIFYKSKHNPCLEIHCCGTSSCLSKKEDTTFHLLDLYVENSKIIDSESHGYRWDDKVMSFVFTGKKEASAIA